MSAYSNGTGFFVRACQIQSLSVDFYLLMVNIYIIGVGQKLCTILKFCILKSSLKVDFT